MAASLRIPFDLGYLIEKRFFQLAEGRLFATTNTFMKLPN